VSFIGTRAGTPLDSRPVVTADGDTLRTTRIYDPGVGAILAEAAGPRASYTFAGDELYVRARIDSSRPHVDPTTGACWELSAPGPSPYGRPPPQRVAATAAWTTPPDSSTDQFAGQSRATTPAWSDGHSV
jgi:hypothetical protein